MPSKTRTRKLPHPHLTSGPYPVGALVHYEQWPTGLNIYNGEIAGEPFRVIDEPGEQPYWVYPVLPTGAGSWTWWSAERVRPGHAALDPWPGNGVPEH